MLVIAFGTAPEHIVCVPDMDPAVIIFSKIVIVETAVQPCGVVIFNFTVIEEVKGGVGEKVTEF